MHLSRLTLEARADQNPVKRGYVELPEHWRWSSARSYAGGEGLIEVDTAWLEDGKLELPGLGLPSWGLATRGTGGTRATGPTGATWAQPGRETEAEACGCAGCVLRPQWQGQRISLANRLRLKSTWF
jgi:hypothetical protein